MQIDLLFKFAYCFLSKKVYNSIEMINKVKILITLSTFLLLSAGASLAEYYCEVMTLQGKATVTNLGEASRELKEGDLIKEGDRIRVEEGTMDLAFDKEWNNVTRLAGNTEVTIRSIYPTGLAMDRGDIFARLEKLPKNSTFEIQTPSCVAAVRGSAYRTIHEEGESRVLNYASSPVEVFGLDAEGRLMDGPVILREAEKTEVPGVGESPAKAERMTENEVKEAAKYRSDVKDEARFLGEEGRVAKIQEIADVEREYGVDLEKRIERKIAEKIAEEGPERTATNENESKAPGQEEKSFERIEIADRLEKVADKAQRAVERAEKETGEKVDKQSDRKEERKRKGEDGQGGGGSRIKDVGVGVD